MLGSFKLEIQSFLSHDDDKLNTDNLFQPSSTNIKIKNISFRNLIYNSYINDLFLALNSNLKINIYTLDEKKSKKLWFYLVNLCKNHRAKNKNVLFVCRAITQYKENFKFFPTINTLEELFIAQQKRDYLLNPIKKRI